MRKQPRKLSLSRETLRHLSGGATGIGIIDILRITKPRSECPVTCSIDPPSICAPEACSMYSCPDGAGCPQPIDGVVAG